MNIDIRMIPFEGLAIEEDISPKGLALEGEEKFEKPINVRVQASLAGNTLLVNGSITAEVGFSCSRCLAPFKQVLAVDEFFYSCKLEEEEIIDLTPQIREDIIIALPVKPLCRPDCKGICSRCGKDLNKGVCACVKLKGSSAWDALDDLDVK